MVKKGLTLIELMIAVVLFIMLAAVTVYILRAVLLTWSSQETRSGVDISLDRGIEELVRDLREARQISFVNNDEIRFAQDRTNFYIYYFYNADDPYPPSFNQSLYEVRKAALPDGISGNLYDSGDIKVIDVLPPPTSDLSLSSNLIILDLSITRKDETIRSRTQVRPRNL